MTKIELQNGTIAAQLRAASYEEKDNSIGVVWTTGAPVRRRGLDGYYDEVLSLDPAHVRLGRLNAGAPFLNTHRDGNLSDILGVVVAGSAKITGGKGLARIKLSTAPGDADHVQKIKDGVVRNISVGYAIHAAEKIERDGDIPILRVTDWEPLELSAVPVPADAGAQIAQARSKTARSSTVSVTTLPRYSVAAVRARVLAKNMQRNIPMHEGKTTH
jgi:HK97 family phage prohead protease